MQNNEQKQYKTIDKFDRIAGALANLPDVSKTKPTTCQVMSPLIGEVQTFIIQTYRQREVGDFIFIQYVDSNGSLRLAIPPEVADAIARQRDALTSKIRRKVGKDSAAARKARGELPGFMKNKKGNK